MDAVDSALKPLKPVLQSITKNLPKPVDDFAVSLIGSRCSKSLLHNIDVSSSNFPCLQLAVSKALGVAIIAASAVVKLPQLIKLLQSQSAAGLSFLSYLLETASFTITLAYSVRQGFPFSTFGETALVAAQDVAIGISILIFSGRAAWALSFLLGALTVTYNLFNAKMVPMGQLTYLQAGAGMLGVVSKVPQIYTIWSEGGTGQLSAFAVFNYLAGSLARIFTTIQEVDDKLILYGYVAGFTLNAIIAAQMVYYWNKPATASPLTPQKGVRETFPPSSSTTSTSASKGRAATTRRRG